MAALMTSVIDNPGKVAEYIYTCKTMGIAILPPDINEGMAGFSVSGNSIRYGLASIKSIGWPVIEAIVEERKEHGKFKDLKDFALRLSGREVNKRTVESFIKSGAFDSLGGTRKQFMNVYTQIMDTVSQDKKNNLAGQLSLFDIVGEDDRETFEVGLPDVGEFGKELLLSYEKEVLGIYVSGHPLEADEAMWKKHITAYTSDFVLDAETGITKVQDGRKATIGGIIEHKTIKHTKNGRAMAFITLEDLVGTVEVIIWPGDYEKNVKWLTEDSKVFIKGRVSAEEEKDAKLICESIIPFANMPKKLWIKFLTRDDYQKQEAKLLDVLNDFAGPDAVAVYIEETKEIKKFSGNQTVFAGEALVAKLSGLFGTENVKIV
ncbi:MAG TPA: OB-fold nucleic acid binding domain-containing protein, partial [Lachnospiraceae bacterium]|nr:OB-fold nucleic acid binding domain-containing protein [Lachnospiraceae bacterium]